MKVRKETSIKKEEEVKRQKMIDRWKYADRGRLKKDKGSYVTLIYEVDMEMKKIETYENIEDWKDEMLKTYTNGKMSWSHREMFQDLIDEILKAQDKRIIKPEAADKLITMVNE